MSETSKGNDQLQHFASILYQICGELNAPAKVLDCVLAAAQGDSYDVDSLLPFDGTEEPDE
jgi:hypothetical protein